MEKKSKIRDVLEVILSILVIAVVGTSIVFLFIKLGLVMTLIIVCPTVLFLTFLFISIKRDKKKKEEYDKKYMTETVIEDAFFGKLKFELDTAKNMVSCSTLSVPFGKYNPVLRIDDYNEENKDIYFRSLEFAYKNSALITQKMKDSFYETFSNNKEVTPEAIDDNLVIDRISISKRGEYFLMDVNFYDGVDIAEGDPDSLVITITCNPNSKNLFKGFFALTPAAYIDCKTNEICWTLEE